MLADLESRYCVDTTRVFAAGISNGASFAGVLGCQPGVGLAAIGMVAGINGYAICKNLPPLPVVGFNGTDDPIVPYAGGKIFGGADQKGGGIVPAATTALADWAQRNGCGAAAPTTNVAADVQLRTYSGCRAATELYVLQGDGHTWPGATAVAGKVLGRTNTNISATRTMLDFFAAQHR
jgi:polyhydroxybutyrate depolymerase